MHDPYTLAFEIYLGKKKRKDNTYRTPIITIWHKDPESDGTDDSCGWFMRPRHCDQKILAEIKDSFAFNMKHYWFDENGNPKFSTIATLMLMYQDAAWAHFKRNHKKVDRFMKNNCHRIIQFAENPHDSMYNDISGKFYPRDLLLSDELAKTFAGTIYSDIVRAERKWWQHPRWHIHHWNIKILPLRWLKRRYWDKCCKCGKRGFKGEVMGNWGGTLRWHRDCNNDVKQSPEQVSEKCVAK